MSLSKKYLKNKTCNVTFRIPKNEVTTAKSVSLVGEFNNWDTKATPMKKLKNGSFTIGIQLNTEKEYQYRYLIDGKNWISDHEADKLVHSAFGNCENSVVSV
ncbi:MAG: isoamylase early set domain-containing protein [Deltaproteobacteria bacterium]|nr:isoamylase early set domain-containing protein [Deltaproteobacteria bacterium]